jgi:hypothetical protein
LLIYFSLCFPLHVQFLYVSSLPIIWPVCHYSFLPVRCYPDQLDTCKISCCKDCSRNIVGRLTTYLVIRCIPPPRCVPKSLPTPFPSASQRLCPVRLPSYFVLCLSVSTCAFARTRARTHAPTHV